MNAGKYHFGFAVDWMREDLGADRNGAKLPVTALVDKFYKDVQAMGASAGTHPRCSRAWKTRFRRDALLRVGHGEAAWIIVPSESFLFLWL